jgi:hypothetical protein
MPQVRIYNPRRKKTVTREEAERRRAQAAYFLREVAEEPDWDLADEIESLSVEEYAARKGFQLSNPGSGEEVSHLKQEEFLEKVKDVVTQAVKETRSNPTNAQSATAPFARSAESPARLERAAERAARQAGRSAQRKLDKVLDEVDDALSALDKGREDEAADILDEVLEEYSEDEEDEES